jgi:hypothetical protein
MTTRQIDNKKTARIPHNLFMLNLALVHLLMTPGIIALDVGLKAILIPLAISLAIMLISWKISKRSTTKSDEFVHQHWLLAVKRYRILLISYAITAALILLGHLLALSSPDQNMQEILDTVFLRIAIMPVLIAVMICFFLETSALGLAAKGELPESNKRSTPS